MKTFGNKAKTSAKVTSVKRMATSGDSSVIGCCAIPYHSQGALKFDLEINFKVFSKFSPPLKKDPLAHLSVSEASRGYQSGQTFKRRKHMHALASAPEAWTLNKYCFIVKMRTTASIESSCQSWGH